MTTFLDDFRNRFVRKAVVMELGGFRPSEALTASWFGRVTLGTMGEQWPYHDGQPMLALAQINITELPFRPPGLDDIAFITVFISSQQYPLQDEPNGTSWVLRAYKSIAELIPIANPAASSPLKPLQMRPTVVDYDYPCFDDVPVDLREKLRSAYLSNQFRNVYGIKLGGWPTLIQSELFWGPLNQHPIKPDYVFQIDSVEQGNWLWADNGVGYFGRGTLPGKKDDWVLEWQSL